MVGLCKQNDYQSYMYGFFSEEKEIELVYTRSDSIDNIQVKLNLISVVKDLNFQVKINN